MIKNVLKIIYIVGQLLGFILIVISMLRLNKAINNHKKFSNDFLSEDEIKSQSKIMKILIIGIAIICTTLILQVILFFI